jgi:hypothetical protein
MDDLVRYTAFYFLKHIKIIRNSIYQADFDRLQASEQYFTLSQFFSQALRQVISLPHTTQGLLGR